MQDHDRRGRMSDEMPTVSDAVLMARAETDAHAYRMVYDRHAEAIFAWFRARGVDHHTSLDLTAETFAEAWCCRQRFVDQRSGSAAPWLFGIARHTLSHAARHRAVVTAARERMAMTAEVHAIDRETEALFARLDGVDPALQRSLDDLPDASRRAVEARVLHGQSYEEIADELQCTPLAVRIRVSRAMTTLRNDLSIETREGNTA